MSNLPPKILIVDDKTENLIALERILGDLDAEFVRATSGNDALKLTLENEFAIALMDVQMPHMDGFETVELMRQGKSTRHLPVIFISAIYKENFYQIKGIQTGAIDFIAKPIVPEILVGKVRIFLELYKNRRSLEQEIHQRKASEERFSSLVHTIPDIVYRIDDSGRFTFLNPAVSRLGYEPEDLIGRHFSEFLQPPDRKLVSRNLVLPEYEGQQTGDEKAPKLFDERRTGARKTMGLELLLALKGKKEMKPAVMVPISDDHVVVEINSSGMWEVNPDARTRRFMGTVGVIRDITDRKQIEQMLRESKDRLKTILNYAQAGIIVVDPQNRKIVDANPAALELMGLDLHHVVGSVCHDLICPAEKNKCPVLDLNMKIDNSERMLRQPDGSTIPILKTVAPIKLDGRPHLLESFVDISQLKETEDALKKSRDEMEFKVEKRTDELKKSQAKLMQTEKIAALGTLTAGIAHELNNPMMGMLNFVQYCLKHVENDHRIYEILQDTEMETQRCIKIVQNLLKFSRIEQQDEESAQSIQLGELVNRVCRLLTYRIEKENVNLVVNIDKDTPKIRAKISNLQQVILNLISNALDAMAESREKELTITINHRNGSVHFSITDTGDGIAEAAMDYIFDPFFTTKPVGKGTGLGLSVCQGIINDHGGEITCISRLGEPTTFVFALPSESSP